MVGSEEYVPSLLLQPFPLLVPSWLVSRLPKPYIPPCSLLIRSGKSAGICSASMQASLLACVLILHHFTHRRGLSCPLQSSRLGGKGLQQ
jgi:hypothetical protein